MYRIILLFLLIFNCCFSYSQYFELSWGEMERSPGSLLEILPRSNSDFYSLRWSGGRALGTYRIVDHENLASVNQTRIKQVAQSGIANFETAVYLNNELFVFLSDKADGYMMLYAQPYDSELNITEESILIASYPNSKISAKPNFSILTSDNRNFLGIVWEIPGRRNISDSYGYVIMDSDMHEIQNGEYSVPFEGNMSTINQHHIANNGDYYLCLTEHNKPNNRLFSRSFDNFKALHVYKLRSNELYEFSIDLESKRIDDINMSSNNNNMFTLTGIYGTGRNNHIEGVFILSFDSAEDSVVYKGFMPFDVQLIQNSRVNRSFLDRSNPRNRKQNNELYSYKIRDLFTLEDGTLCGSIEQYYIFERSSYDSRTGVSSTIYYYYYDDIIAFKIGINGTFDWQVKIPKSQVSMNDGGPFSSYSSFTGGKNLYFIFNDNVKNYDEMGSYSRKNNSCYSFNLSRRKNVAAIVQVNLESGTMDRNTLFSRKELNSIVVPKMFKLNIQDEELLLYAIMKGKERFGLLNYSPK